MTLPLLLVLLGCGPTPNERPAEDGPVLVDECDPVVTPASPLLDTDGGPVQAHEDTFGTERPDPFHVHLGWPASDPSRSISILWRTDVDTLASVVEYGVDGKLTERVETVSFLYGGASAGEGPLRIHELKLCGDLEPNTTYSYRVGGEGHWSDTFTFTTPGEPGSFDSYRIGFIGDSRGAHETWDDLLAQMESHSPDFYVFGGDMVDLGPSQADWDAWFDAAGTVFAENVLVPAHGNHEFLAVHYFAQFSLPNNEEWFSLRYGNLHLVSLNDVVRSSDQIGTDQVAYLDDVFTEHDSDWQIAVHHQAMYSASDRHGSNLTLRELWAPKFDQHGVDLVVAGHNHLYERSVPIKGDAQSTEADGTTYIVTGGAGAPIYSGLEDHWFTEVANPIEHFVIGDFGPTGATFEVYDRSDNLIDSFTLSAR